MDPEEREIVAIEIPDVGSPTISRSWQIETPDEFSSGSVVIGVRVVREGRASPEIEIAHIQVSPMPVDQRITDMFDRAQTVIAAAAAFLVGVVGTLRLARRSLGG